MYFDIFYELLPIAFVRNKIYFIFTVFVLRIFGTLISNI